MSGSSGGRRRTRYFQAAQPFSACNPVSIPSGHRTPRRLVARSRAAAAAALVALCVAACGSAATGPKLPSGHSDLQSIIEAHGFVQGDPQAALSEFKAMGVDRVRVYIAWETLAPDPTSRQSPAGFDASDPAAYPSKAEGELTVGWDTYDAIVRAAAAIGIGLDVTVGPPPPLWAATPGAPKGTHRAAEWKPSATDFGAFVHALGERYSGHYTPAGQSKPLPRVDFWSIWNEPNYGQYLAPQAIDHGTVAVAPSLYRDLLDSAWSALAATGHTPATDTILFGETAPRAPAGVPGNFNGTRPLPFIRALYCVDSSYKPLQGSAATAAGCPATAAGSAAFAADNPALFEAGGFADHPYPDAEPPTYVTPARLGEGYADFAVLGNLESTLDQSAAAYGHHPAFRIYSTEFGYWTNPPDPAGLPLATAAAYLNQSEYLSWRNPRIGSYDQYLLSDPLPPNTFDSGIYFADGQPKPSVFDAYTMPLWLPVTSGAASRPLVVWGCVRSAPVTAARTHRPQKVEIQFAPSGKTSFDTVRTLTLDAGSCYFVTSARFPGAGTVRLAWTGSGQAFYSRTQEITQ